MRDQEDFQLLGVIDGSVKAAMEALGDELMRYLKEAGEEFEEKKEPIKPVYSSSPFVSVFKGFAELFTSFKGNKKVKKLNKKPTQTQIFHGALAKQKAEQQVKKKMWETYHHFKKQHGMLNW